MKKCSLCHETPCYIEKIYDDEDDIIPIDTKEIEDDSTSTIPRLLRDLWVIRWNKNELDKC